MYETVKTVNGYDIYRMIGTHSSYWVDIRKGEGFKQSAHFRTIKAATAYIESRTK